MSLLSTLGNLGKVVGGYQAEQAQQAQIDAAKARAKDVMDDRASLAALGRAFGAPAPTPPVPQGPGQASVPSVPSNGGPATPAQWAQLPPNPAVMQQVKQIGDPSTPPGGTLPGGPPSGPPPAAARPVPPPQPPAQAPQAPLGMMTADQLAARIRAANPGIDNRPDLLVRAMEKGQALLAPQGKAELAMLQLQARIDKVNQEMQMKELTLQQKADLFQQANQFKMQLEQFKQSQQNSRLAEKTDAMLTALLTKLSSQEGIAREREAGRTADRTERGREADQREAGAQKRAEMGNRKSLVQAATKAGVSVDPSWDNDEIQSKAAEAIAKKAEKGVISDSAAQFFAEAARKDPSMFSHLPRNTETRNKVLEAYTRLPDIKPEEVAAARVALQGASSEARKVGTIAGSAAVAAEELGPMGDLVTEMSNKVSRTKYPTLNSIELAIKKGSGDPDVVEFFNKVQALKSAYTQILTRGGVPGVEAQKRADELINPSMSPSQIGAAVKAMRQEAETVKGAAKRATEGVTGKIMGNGASGEMPTLKSTDKDGYAKLPPGASYKVEGDDTIYTKR